MSKSSSKTSTSLGSLFTGSAIGAALAYFPLASAHHMAIAWYDWPYHHFAAWKQVKRGRGMWVNIAIGALGGGSVYLTAIGLSQYVLVARLLAFLLFAFVGLSALGALLKVLFALGGMAMMVFIAIYVFEQSQNNQLGDQAQVEEAPISESDTHKEETNAEGVEDVLISHLREWKDYQKRSYKGKLEVWKSSVNESESQKKQIDLRGIRDAREYWRKIYISFIRNDSGYMDRILALFLTLAEEKGLSEEQLVKTIVACVQDIPYSLVYRGDCARIGEEQPSLAGLAQRVPCKSEVEFGIQTPTSFMNDLQGDCDTRTVFLYTILDKIGYKVAILNSDVHGHSMLGVAVPAVGKYKSHRGRKYYFWETTAKGWKLGVLPPEMGSSKDWYVVVSNG